jgi:hypothetical protein
MQADNDCAQVCIPLSNKVVQSLKQLVQGLTQSDSSNHTKLAHSIPLRALRRYLTVHSTFMLAGPAKLQTMSHFVSAILSYVWPIILLITLTFMANGVHTQYRA